MATALARRAALFGLAFPCSSRSSNGFLSTSLNPLSPVGGLPSFFKYSSSIRGSSSVLPPPTGGSRDVESKEDDVIVSIDRSGLVPHSEHRHDKSGKMQQSAMARHISALIKFRGGPISVAEYMSEVLTNPSSGFYMNRDVFGSRGDFVTSPDSSQMFGELLGVWSMLLWEQMGEPKKLALVELGPGRGTLLADLIRGTAKFQAFSRALTIHLVECSPTLRGMQESALQVVSNAGVPISWHMGLDEVPRGVPSIILAHEFYDALPIHQFQRTPRGWCEKLVDVGESADEFRFVLSPKPTTASTLYLERRLQAATNEERSQLQHVEVCPEAWKLTADIARRVAEDGGAALIIDYGQDSIVADSLQAIRDHRFVKVLENPGMADLSAYVDFAAIKHEVEGMKGSASVYGPVTQSKFLGSLGINFRLQKLLSDCDSDIQKEALQLGYWILVGDGPAPWLDDGGDGGRTLLGMGSAYKVLAIVQSNLAPPVGFI